MASMHSCWLWEIFDWLIYHEKKKNINLIKINLNMKTHLIASVPSCWLRDIFDRLIYHKKKVNTVVVQKPNILNAFHTKPPSDQFRVQLSNLWFISELRAKQTKPNIFPSKFNGERIFLNCFKCLFASFQLRPSFRSIIA